MRHRREVSGPDVATPQPRHEPWRVVVAVRPHVPVLGVDDQLHRHVDDGHTLFADGKRAKVVGGIGFHRAGRVGGQAVGVVDLLDGNVVDGVAPQRRDRQGEPQDQRREHRDGQQDHVAQPQRLAERAGEGARPPGRPQPAEDVVDQLVLAGPGHRGEGGDPVVGAGTLEVVPHPDRAPVVGQHVYGPARAEFADHRGEVVGEAVHAVGRHRLGRRRRTDPAVVVAQDPEPLGQQRNDPVPQHVRVGKAVHQHDGRALGVALVVDRDAGAVGAVHEMLGRVLWCRHRTSPVWLPLWAAALGPRWPHGSKRDRGHPSREPDLPWMCAGAGAVTG